MWNLLPWWWFFIILHCHHNNNDYFGEKEELVLIDKDNNEQRPAGFDFTPGKDIKVKFELGAAGVDIYCNDKFIATSDYLQEQPMGMYVNWGFDITQKGELKGFTVEYE